MAYMVALLILIYFVSLHFRREAWLDDCRSNPIFHDDEYDYEPSLLGDLAIVFYLLVFALIAGVILLGIWKVYELIVAHVAFSMIIK